jgi:hypothetical protein
MTDQRNTANNPAQDEVPDWGTVRRALHKLLDFSADCAIADFPTEALAVLERYVDAPTDSLAISAKLSALKTAMHSLKRIAEGAHEPVGFAAIAIKHILGPGNTVDKAVGPAPQQLPFAVTDEELAALHRFHECALDGEGYDVPPEMMRRLAELGLVNRKSGAYFETTAFGQALLDGAFVVPAALKPAPPEDPAVFDQWMHERLFANPPQPVTPFDAWQAGRLEERRAAAGRHAPASSQRALFEDWRQRDGELPASHRGAMLKIWRVALEAQPNVSVRPYSLTPAQMAQFDTWYDSVLPFSTDENGLFAAWQWALASQSAA